MRNLIFFKIAGRFLKILFKRNKSIQCIYLDYSDRYLFESGYIIVNYKFKNALWYKFGKYYTTQPSIKIFNLKNFDKEFDLIVYGLFRKKVYRLKFEPQHILETKNFQTQIEKINRDVNVKPVPILNSKPINFNLDIVKLRHRDVSLKMNTIKISSTNFNLTDFI
jgi:hypothetical protein